MNRAVRFAVLLLALGLLPGSALAHVGAGDVHTFTGGVMHPLGGLDHVLAAFAVGLWAALAGGRRALLWPLALVAAMTMAALAGAHGVALPAVEPAIAATVVALGLLIALAVKAPTPIGVVLVALFALVHGHAHGAEGGAALSYLAGLVAATAALHLAGLAAGRVSLAVEAPLLARTAGAAIALAGAWIMLA